MIDTLEPDQRIGETRSSGVDIPSPLPWMEESTKVLTYLRNFITELELIRGSPEWSLENSTHRRFERLLFYLSLWLSSSFFWSLCVLNHHFWRDIGLIFLRRIVDHVLKRLILHSWDIPPTNPGSSWQTVESLLRHLPLSDLPLDHWTGHTSAQSLTTHHHMTQCTDKGVSILRTVRRRIGGKGGGTPTSVSKRERNPFVRVSSLVWVQPCIGNHEGSLEQDRKQPFRGPSPVTTSRPRQPFR